MKIDALRKSVRTVLINDWDPIGVRDEPAAQDEYDGYIGGVLRLLMDNASAEEVYRHLRHIEADAMGLDGDRDKTCRVAEVLVALRKASG